MAPGTHHVPFGMKNVPHHVGGEQAYGEEPGQEDGEVPPGTDALIAGHRVALAGEDEDEIAPDAEEVGDLGQLREFAKALAAAVLAWLAVDLPVMIAAPSGWAYFYAFSKDRGADWGSVWYMFEHFNVPVLGNPQLSALNKLTEVFFAVACAAIALLALAAPRRPRLPQLCFLVLAAFLMTNKVWSPQYVVWLVPLAVLARPRLWPYLLWQLAEVAYFFGIWGYLIFVYAAGGYQVTGYQGISTGWYFATLLARFLTVGLLAGYVVRDILVPERDAVRALGGDDPAGGVLDHAEDRFRLRFNPGGRGLSIDRASASQIGG